MLDYKRIVKPLITLLGSKSSGKWTMEHTAAMNRLAALVWARICLGLIDYTYPVRIHVDCDSAEYSAVMVQGEGASYNVVAMAGRAFTASERACPLVERLLITALWSIKKWARYTLYTQVTIVVPYAAEVMELNTGAIGDLLVRM